AATFILVDSKSQRDFLLAERIVSASKSAVLGKGSVSGVDVEKFRPDSEARHRIRADYGIPDKDIVLIFVGRLTRDNGVLDLAAAFVRIAEDRDDVWLLVVGADEQLMHPAMRAACGRHAGRLQFVDFTSEPQ